MADQECSVTAPDGVLPVWSTADEPVPAHRTFRFDLAVGKLLHFGDDAENCPRASTQEKELT